MACGGCRGGGNRHLPTTGDLRKFAFLTPHQLRTLKAQDEAAAAAAAAAQPQVDPTEGEGQE